MNVALKEIYALIRTIVLILIIDVPFVLAQPSPNPVDSITQVVASLEHDTSRVNYLNDVSKSYWRTNNNTSLKYAQDALELGLKIDFKSGQCRALNYIGIAYTNIGDYPQAEIFLQQAYDLAIDISNEDHKLKILNSQGIVQRKKGNYPLAIEYMLGALRLLEKKGNDRSIGSVTLNIGNIYFSLDEFDSAIVFYERALEKFEKLKFYRGIELIYNNLGDVYGHTKKYSHALSYFKKSFDYKLKSDNVRGMATTSVNIGELYVEMDSLDVARKYFYDALTYFDRAGIKTDIAHAYFGIGRVDLQKGLYQKSLVNLKKAYQIAEQSNLKMVLKLSSQMLSRSYDHLGQKEEALNYFKKFVAVKDSLTSEDNYKEVTMLKHRFEIEKNKQQILLLEAQNLRARVEIEKSEARQQLVAIIVVFIFFLTIYAFISQRQKSKLKQDLLSAEISELRTKLTNLIGPENLELDDLNDKLVNPLSEREFEIYKLAITQKTNPDIASDLCISISTVKFHLNNVYTKLGVNNRKEALEFAVKST